VLAKVFLCSVSKN